jgi:hypothetical protein
MSKFRLPRKTKKKIRKGFYLYPKDERDCYLVAWPKKYQEDYNAFKKGILSNMLDDLKKINKSLNKSLK